VLPIFEKVLELVVKEQLEMHLKTNGRSKMIGIIFMDLKRAFEQ